MEGAPAPSASGRCDRSVDRQATRDIHVRRAESGMKMSGWKYNSVPAEPFRRDADDSEGRARKQHAASDHVGGALKVSFPHPVADHGHSR